RPLVRFTFDDLEAFRRATARAPTFGFPTAIEQSEQTALESGGRLSDRRLGGDEGTVDAPLRFPDEFARHKALDIFGDFYLLGRPIRGRIEARMTGHSDNVQLLRQLRNHFGPPRGATA